MVSFFFPAQLCVKILPILQTWNLNIFVTYFQFFICKTTKEIQKVKGKERNVGEISSWYELKSFFLFFCRKISYPLILLSRSASYSKSLSLTVSNSRGIEKNSVEYYLHNSSLEQLYYCAVFQLKLLPFLSFWIIPIVIHYTLKNPG